ncbi:Bzip transcription factor [Phytophthora megakarya]|uniref:Bzip transcription factor n=1 Tax=Phytophthora megakarya TaxID=4795 RepID=A0A225UMW9_9STRA|nr:Bzip transcription factor [Phytophthora megakarya]
MPIDRRQETATRYDASRIAPFAPRSFKGDRQANGSFLSPVDRVRTTPPPIPAATTSSLGKRKLSNYYNTSIRRQQCRTNQARYRDRQRAAQLQLENSVGELQQEVDQLKRQYRDLASRERNNHSPWSIVAEVFHLLESSIRSPWRLANSHEMKNHKDTRQSLATLEKAFASDVAMGNLTGIDELMNQLRQFSQYFGEPQLKLERIEAMVPGVMAGTAKLHVTVTEHTLRHIFPHLSKQSDVDDDVSDKHNSLYDRLLGKRIQCCCSMRFLFDEESGRVVRLETQIDLVPGMLRVLENLMDVSIALEHALISSECIINGGSVRGDRKPRVN